VDRFVVRLLLDRGANPLVRNSFNNETCLHVAVRALVNGGIGFDEVKGKAFLKLLLEAGLRPTDEDEDGTTPLDLASGLCLARRKIFEEALIECGIKHNGLIEDGEICPGCTDYSKGLSCFCDPDWRTKFFGHAYTVMRTMTPTKLAMINSRTARMRLPMSAPPASQILK
jgi:hypothetical protein